MEFPWRCQCGHENLIDLEHLETRQMTGVLFSKGFACEKCELWNTIIYTTRSLDEAFLKLLSCPTDHPKFRFLFAKTLKKAEGVNLRGTHG